jgi:hypothetical protein
MRTIRVKDEGSTSTWLWIAAGATLGLTAGILVAEKASGRGISVRALTSRGRRLALRALDQWEPLLEAAQSLHSAWTAPEEDEEEDWEEESEDGAEAALEDEDDEADEGEEEDDDDDEDLDDEDLDDDDLDDDEDLEEEEDEDLDDEDGDDQEDDDLDDDLDDDSAEAEASPIDERVLEAFSNDPVLSARGVEIEADDEGRVILHGRVHTPREVQHAVTIARGVPGVASVRQRLDVRDRR